MDQPLDQELNQQLGQLQDRIKLKLNEHLATLLADSGKEGAKQLRRDDLRTKLNSADFRNGIEKTISAEVDSFFKKLKKEELFSSALSYTLPAGPAKKLEKALIEEITRVMLNQFESKSTTLRQHLSTIPDVMINRRWIQRTFEGLLNDVAEHSPQYIQNLNLSPVFAEIIPELINHVEVNQAALVDLKRSLNQEIQAMLDSYIEDSQATLKNAKESSSENGVDADILIKETTQMDSVLLEALSNDIASEFSGFIGSQSTLSEIPVASTPSTHFTPGRPGICNTLVIHCSDPRFLQGTNEFLQNELGLSESEYAKIVVPGGIQALTLNDYLPKFTWAMRKWINFMDELIEFERVICISHDDCHWYKATKFMPIRRGSSKLSTTERQVQDLNTVRNIMNELVSMADVELYYMQRPTQTSIRFERVS